MTRRSKPNSKRKPADPRLVECLVRAEEIGKKEDCIARNVAELEMKLPAEMIAGFLGDESRLSPVVVQNGLQKFVQDAGDPSDPIERTLLVHLYLLHFRSLSAYSFMASGGLGGYKA